ncbi:SRPBCC domain-containing protein [Paenibacillus sp. J22TS3]|uniref:SRPBCC domain-containing protein n=1 Tax=Paenibacillus sp. J22TS3 TaxID=2807192 RepID=UPI001B09DBF7|nr:SRPBCC domain-containing protein [Paenibacillus sp. J22TS3]GIP22124.1 ATPase [Paenibacillus sp. J22TS3]
MSNTSMTRVEETEFIIERIFNAPRELVFKAFSEAEHLKNWWGPRGWTVPVCHVDFRPGGVWHYCMKCEDKNQGDFYGMESWGKGVYHEIVNGEKIVYTDYFSDADGNEAPGAPSSTTTVIFEDADGKTKVTSRSKYDSIEAVKAVMDMGMEEGITQTWDRLEEHLQEIR